MFNSRSASLSNVVFFTRLCMMRSTYCWSFQVVFNIFLKYSMTVTPPSTSSTSFIITDTTFWKYIYTTHNGADMKKYIFYDTSIVDCCIWHNPNPTEHIFWQKVKFLNLAKCNTDQTAILSMVCARFYQLFWKFGKNKLNLLHTPSLLNAGQTSNFLTRVYLIVCTCSFCIRLG